MSIMCFLKKNTPLFIRNKIIYSLPSLFFKKKSFSQSGEDLLVNYLLNLIPGLDQKKYLDIGANHPFRLSNTALLYEQGGSGFLVEPDPYFAGLLRRKRPRDKVLQAGVHFSGETNASFYIMDSPTLNTFSKEEMLRYVAMGHKLDSIIETKLMDINEILDMAGNLDFLNLDIEGLDYKVLEMIDWDSYRPKCICVETIPYERNKEPKKNHQLINLMLSKGYVLYADTFINSIFVDGRKWKDYWGLIQ